MADDAGSGAAQPVNLAKILRLLSTGTVVEEHGMMRSSSNYTFLVTLEHDDIKTMAIYKPQRGERPLWDFPDGTLCSRETAAYLVSEALGWSLVPPTVLRHGPSGVGMVQ